MEKNYQEPAAENRQQGAEDEIDLIELARKLWDGRKLIYKWCAIAAIAGLIVGFSIPKEYTSSAILSPEASGNQMSGSISALAGMMGLNVGHSSRDAVYPSLYPDVVSSVPFLTDLFALEVSDRKGELHTTLYDYIDTHTRNPWWSAVIALPFKALGWFMSLFSEKQEVDNSRVNTFRLTRDQMRVVKALNGRIGVSVDKKTSVVTISVMMQDPLISATVAEAVIANLKSYITDYRTSKARHDLEFTENLFEETKANYERAQER